MELSDRDFALVGALAGGLPLSERPYAELGAEIGMAEDEVIARLEAMIAAGVIRRFGVIVRHRELGFVANAMAVWDVPDARVGDLGRCLAAEPAVSLCYRRPRRPPRWPYNLFCMVHGRDRGVVEDTISRLNREHGLDGLAHAVLFGTRRFKQCGANYAAGA